MEMPGRHLIQMSTKIQFLNFDEPLFQQLKWEQAKSTEYFQSTEYITSINSIILSKEFYWDYFQ